MASKNLNDEEREYRRAQKLEKREHEKIAKRFRVITAEEFERTFGQDGVTEGGEINQKSDKVNAPK